MEIVGLAVTLASVIDEYDLESDPDIIPGLRVLQTSLNNKLKSWPNPGPIINLDKWNL